MKSMLRIFSIIALAAGMLTQPGISTAHAGCANIHVQGVANLGFIEVAPGTFVLGGLPTPVTIGGVPGLLSSVVTGLESSGVNSQGAQHFTLIHTFVSTDSTRPGCFVTDDRAVSAPAGTDPNLGIINDVLTIVSGTGVFANADGFIMNHAIVDLNTLTLTFSGRGRVCGDGL